MTPHRMFVFVLNTCLETFSKSVVEKQGLQYYVLRELGKKGWWRSFFLFENTHDRL